MNAVVVQIPLRISLAKWDALYWRRVGLRYLSLKSNVEVNAVMIGVVLMFQSGRFPGENVGYQIVVRHSPFPKYPLNTLED